VAAEEEGGAPAGWWEAELDGSDGEGGKFRAALTRIFTVDGIAYYCLDGFDSMFRQLPPTARAANGSIRRYVLDGRIGRSDIHLTVNPFFNDKTRCSPKDGSPVFSTSCFFGSARISIM
jgi:hypothetical protein